ncbi:MAG: Cell division ATP-binding protein FtsE [Candidatus Moranbacteria bacterium GW2011_GWA2_39_41]|nr:MAG: Cell division ATP-binding protein FtsE [Candidatus Moranbacteria bacterium GW2011_GWA2_39_41]
MVVAKKNIETKERPQKTQKPTIKFEGVCKIYKGNFPALEDINLTICEGEFVSVVGHSGSGKSTLLKLIYAEELPTGGEVYFNESLLNQISKRNLPFHRRNIGTIFQDFKLLPKKNVFENVAYALEVAGILDEEINENVPQILDIVGLGDKIHKYPHQLSGGEQQRVVIARALVHAPTLIIADEPTGNLDPKSSLEIVDLLMKINDLGTTVILASHDKDIVDKVNRRVLVLNNGKVVADQIKGKYKSV